VERIEFAWRESIDNRQLKKAVKSLKNLKGVLFNHCETSTGALNDIRKAAEIVHRHSKALVIVDAISTIGVTPFKMDEWNINVAITASNKGLQNPPGLIFVALNDNAWNFVQRSDLSTYYFSFKKAKNALEKEIGTAFTPAISLFYGLQQAIREIQQKSIETVWEEHKKLAHAFRKTLKYLGLNIWPNKPSDSLTMIEIPREFQANKIIAELKDSFGFVLSKGQGILSNKVIRIGHLENVNPETDAKLLAALEAVLKSTGMKLAHTNSFDFFLKSFRSR
jgi:aspartate aminotransferase-like enzyme